MKKINIISFMFLVTSLGAMVKEIDNKKIGTVAPKEEVRKVLIRTKKEQVDLEKELVALSADDIVIVKKPTPQQKRIGSYVKLFPLSAPSDYVYGKVILANPYYIKVQYGPYKQDITIYERTEVIKTK